MPTFKLTLEYDGTAYAGWQRQLNQPTVQAEIETALHRIAHTATPVIGAGRTDSGVHALGQVASFFADKEYDLHRILRGLNALTPTDITIKSVEFVADSFDARRDGHSRIYEYHILNRSTPSPFYLNRALHVHESLDVAAMREAISCLIGEHDFTSFRAAGCEAAHPVRKVYRTTLEQRAELLVYTIEATAFLRHMVRNIVGTLIEVGKGLRTAQSFSELLEACDRTKAGPTAPPHGLFLMEVKY